MDVALLVVYVVVALAISFLCSIAEAVLLSVSDGHIAVLEREQCRSGALLRRLTADIDRPLAAILTLNTIAHTMGAAGAGAQAAIVFGSGTVGIFSAVLTFLILILSEIIPKTLGAHYWRRLASPTAYGLRLLINLLHPFVRLSEMITRLLTRGSRAEGVSRGEIRGIAESAARDGALSGRELAIVRNLVTLRDVPVSHVMTPRTVMFALPDAMQVATFFHKHDGVRFSRIPIYRDEPEHLVGFVLRSDLLLAYGRGNGDRPLSTYTRELTAVLNRMSALRALEHSIPWRRHMLLVVDEYGDTQGLVTLEDLVETLLGEEIVDEGDKAVDMQALARRQARRRFRSLPS